MVNSGSNDTVSLPAVRLPRVLRNSVELRCRMLDITVSQGVRRALRQWTTASSADMDLEDAVRNCEAQFGERIPSKNSAGRVRRAPRRVIGKVPT
jgi:hypothetical protein